MSYALNMNVANSLPLVCQQTLAEELRPDLFKALCDPVRISIVATLAARSETSTVSDLTSCCGIDFSGVSRHLKILREAGLVSATKRGREVRYQLNTDDLIATLRAIANALDACKADTGPK